MLQTKLQSHCFEVRWNLHFYSLLNYKNSLVTEKSYISSHNLLNNKFTLIRICTKKTFFEVFEKLCELFNLWCKIPGLTKSINWCSSIIMESWAWQWHWWSLTKSNSIWWNNWCIKSFSEFLTTKDYTVTGQWHNLRRISIKEAKGDEMKGVMKIFNKPTGNPRLMILNFRALAIPDWWQSKS